MSPAEKVCKAQGALLCWGREVSRTAAITSSPSSSTKFTLTLAVSPSVMRSVTVLSTKLLQVVNSHGCLGAHIMHDRGGRMGTGTAAGFVRHRAGHRRSGSETDSI